MLGKQSEFQVVAYERKSKKRCSIKLIYKLSQLCYVDVVKKNNRAIAIGFNEAGAAAGYSASNWSQEEISSAKAYAERIAEARLVR